MPTPPRLTVARLDLWVNDIFDTLIGNEPNLNLQVLPRQADHPATLAGLVGAHAYHVSAAKDELARSWFVSEALLAQCPELICVSSGGAGYDTVDVPACTRDGVAVVNQAGANAASVAEMTFALLLALVKRVVESDQALRHRQGFSREDLMGNEIEGNTIGLVGIGEIGRRVARIASGFGMNVLAYDPLVSEADITARGARAVDLDTLLKSSDVVSLHCPLDSSTRLMMDAAAFARMKPGARFISTARGGVHDEAALLDALESGHLAGAGLDVWMTEPPGNDAPLLQRQDVVATHHTGGVSHEGRRKVAQGSAQQIISMLNGERPPKLLNPEVWPITLDRLARLRG